MDTINKSPPRMTLSPRIRRLQKDYEHIVRHFAESPFISIANTEGTPPEKYVIRYNIRGLYTLADGSLQERSEHLLEVNLSLGYPRRAPHCKLTTPLFHPNFDEASVCTGDFWAAAEGLDELIIRIGRMIAYQEYNVKSPLNGLAAKWVAENEEKLPVDTREIAPALNATPQSSATNPVMTAAPEPITDIWAGQIRITDDDVEPRDNGARIPETQAIPETGQLSHMSSTSLESMCANGQIANRLSLIDYGLRCGRCLKDFRLEISPSMSAITCPHCNTVYAMINASSVNICSVGDLILIRNNSTEENKLPHLP